MQKIKILYGLEAAGGGALKHLIYLATRLDNRYFDITVILSNQRQENIDCELTKLQNAGVKVHIMPIRRNIHPGDIILLFKYIPKFPHISDILKHSPVSHRSIFPTIHQIV